MPRLPRRLAFDAGLGFRDALRVAAARRRIQISSSFSIWDLKGGIWSPAPSRMLRKISPSVVPFLYSLGDVRSVASAITASSALPSVPWQPVQLNAPYSRLPSERPHALFWYGLITSGLP